MRRQCVPGSLFRIRKGAWGRGYVTILHEMSTSTLDYKSSCKFICMLKEVFVASVIGVAYRCVSRLSNIKYTNFSCGCSLFFTDPVMERMQRLTRS